MSDHINPNQTGINDSLGSPLPGEPVFILIGKIHRVHGVDGELVAESFSEDPQRLKPGSQIFIGAAHKPLIIQSRRKMNTSWLLAFKGIETPESAGELRNQLIYMDKNDLPVLPEGQFYHFDLVGLTVRDKSGKDLGKLAEVIETGANDVYIVINETGEETLLPAIAQVILEVNLEEHFMVVDPPDWI
jgi:16S rRNA processing protein RimM